MMIYKKNAYLYQNNYHMKINHIALLEGTKHFTGYTGSPNFPPCFRIQLTSLTTELFEPGNNLYGFIDIFYCLPFGEKNKKRLQVRLEDFSDNTVIFYCNVGDLVERVRIGLYYDLPIATLMEQTLEQVWETPALPCPNPDQHIDLLEYIRTMQSDKFVRWYKRNYHPLQAPVDRASMGTFKNWAIASQIIRLVAMEKISNTHLDWAAQNLAGDYDFIKKGLGIND